MLFIDKYENVTFSATGEYTIVVTVNNGSVKVIVNGYEIGTFDGSALDIKLAVGPAIKNYTAHWTSFALTVIEKNN